MGEICVRARWVTDSGTIDISIITAFAEVMSVRQVHNLLLRNFQVKRVRCKTAQFRRTWQNNSISWLSTYFRETYLYIRLGLSSVFTPNTNVCFFTTLPVWKDKPLKPKGPVSWDQIQDVGSQSIETNKYQTQNNGHILNSIFS